MGSHLVGIKSVYALDDIVVGVGLIEHHEVRFALALMDRLKAAKEDGRVYDYSKTDEAGLARLYAAPLPTEFTIGDREAVEIAPEIMVSAGITPGANQEQAKLAIAAPARIRIVRLPRI
jgi:hypothetical protein